MKKKTKIHYRIRPISNYHVVQQLRDGKVIQTISCPAKATFYAMKEKKEEKMKETTNEILKLHAEKGVQGSLSEPIKKPKIAAKTQDKLWKLIGKPGGFDE